MEATTVSVEVKLPTPGDDEFERFVDDVFKAVYERIKKRLQDDVEGAATPSDSI